ncbi:MAG: Nif3-like dinuclear metal center hexameric protein [Spirochaetes bacterium]|nr:Nif3-like dinuclear metal center hexameric protein [Spirochaetota bacterium]
MKVKEITDFLNTKFPAALQEKYDNTGEQIAFFDNDIRNIMLAVDIDTTVIDESIENDCNLIITHHPFLFKPIKKITTGDPSSELLIRLLSNEITLFSLHTNLDKIFYNKLGNLFGIENEQLLIKTDSFNDKDYGFGTCGKLKSPMKLHELLSAIKNTLNLDFLTYSGNDNTSIETIAAVNGAGGSVIEEILSSGSVDCIITGDITYHHYKTAANYGIPVIDAGHFGTEKILLKSLKEEIDSFLSQYGSKDETGLFISQNESNPFKLFI